MVKHPEERENSIEIIAIQKLDLTPASRFVYRFRLPDAPCQPGGFAMARFFSLVLGVLLTMAAARSEAGGDKAKAAPPESSTQVQSVPKSEPSDKLTVDKEKLRELITMPKSSAIIQFVSFTPPNREKKPSSAQEIVALKQRLAANPDAAELYVELGELLNDNEKWKEPLEKALELFPKRIEADRKNGWLRAQFARALLYLRRESEAEKPATKATELAPNDWRCWQTLAWLRSVQWGNLTEAAQTRELSQNELEEAKRYVLDEGRCRDAEVRLAPKESQAYWDRAEFFFRAMLAPYNTSGPSDQKAAIEKRQRMFQSALSDAQEVVRLCPDEMEAHLFLAGIAMMDGLSQVAEEGAGASKSDVGPFADLAGMTKKNKEIVRAVAAKLDKEAQKLEFSELGSRQLATFSFFLGDTKTAVFHAQRAARLAPKTQANWDLLVISLMMQLESQIGDKDPGGEKAKKVAKLEGRKIAEVCEKCFQQLPNDRNCFFMGQMLLAMAQYDDAEKILRTFLKSEPQNSRVRLGLAAVLLLKGDDPAVLAEARRCLDQASKELKDSDDRIYAQLLQGVHLALSGQVRESKAHFAAMRKAEPENNLAKDALAAFSR
jgi:tetratricopeptide (TPR) repeat protein